MTTQKTQKSAVGQYKIFHVGPNAYEVELASSTLAHFRNLSEAHAFAAREWRLDQASGADRNEV